MIYPPTNIIKNDNMKNIKENIEKYRQFYEDVINAPVGKYYINQILETVEESLNYLETVHNDIRLCVNEYLEENRGRLWLYYGITKSKYLTNYWRQPETNLDIIKKMWPFLYNRSKPIYEDFIVDLQEAQREIRRQHERQSTTNPNFTPFHPDGCPGRCDCWMLDDLEQWYEEEQTEIKSSRNIFFNTALQSDFYSLAISDLEEIEEQWKNWIPEKESEKIYSNELKTVMGQTPINLVISWIKQDYNYSSVFSMFYWSDTFMALWNNIDLVEPFINCQREKLKKIRELL
jgi:hypothetical protein